LNSMAEQLKDSVPIKEHVELQAEADELRGEVKKLRDWVDELTGRLRPRKRLRRSRGDTLDDSVDAPNEGEASTVHQDEAASCGGGGGRKSATMLEEHRDITVATRRSKPTETEEEAEWLVVNKVQASAFNDVVEALKQNFEDKLINRKVTLRQKGGRDALEKSGLQEANERKDATIGILRLDVESLKQARDELEEKLRLLNEQLDQIDTTMLDDLSETIRNRVNSLDTERKQILEATELLSSLPELHWLQEMPEAQRVTLTANVCDNLQQLKNSGDLRSTDFGEASTTDEQQTVLEATQLFSRIPELQWIQEVPPAERTRLAAAVCDSLQSFRTAASDISAEDREKLQEASRVLSEVPELQWLKSLSQSEQVDLIAAFSKKMQQLIKDPQLRAKVLGEVPELQWLRSLSQSEQVELTAALSNKMQQLIKDPQLRAKYSAAAAARRVSFFILE
uniref:PLU-1 domain-containing protein n=1 Tax=Macrostomum lignano TaxID=282301 RepID=A0A1I8I9H7_9PLAT